MFHKGGYITSMKKIISLLCYLLLCSSCLVAQEKSSTDQVRHFSPRLEVAPGLDLSPNPIGSPSNPVTVQEYCKFLNDMAPRDYAWGGSDYYESAFMNTDQDWWSSSHKCIYRTGRSPHFHYTVISGHENDIIDAVTHNPNPLYNHVAGQFKEWRKRSL